jgi:hypothetical protein
MVFKWVWKNMLGGAEGTANDDAVTAAEVNDVPNAPDTLNVTDEMAGDAPNHGSSNNGKTAEVASAAVSDGNKKNGGTNTSSRGRKNKLPVNTSESTDAKKARFSVQSDDPKLASSTALPNESLTSTSSRLSYPFDEMFAKLVAYKAEKGHCRVPQNYKDDRKLAAWVKNIRRNQKPGKVVDEKQIEQLNSIGFQWESKAGRPVGATIEAGAKSPARKFRKPIEDDED